MEKPIKPLFEEKDIPLLDEMLRQLKKFKSTTSNSLAEYERKQELPNKIKIENYQPYFEIFKRYNPSCRIWINREILGFKRYNVSEIINSYNNNGFRAIYDEYLADLEEWDRYNMLRLEEIDRANITRHQARNINWEKRRSIIAMIISGLALLLSGYAIFKEQINSLF